jgi:ribosome-binding factor A
MPTKKEADDVCFCSLHWAVEPRSHQVLAIPAGPVGARLPRSFCRFHQVPRRAYGARRLHSRGSVMRFKGIPPKELLSSCAAVGPEDGGDPRDFFKNPSEKVTNRKALQLCGQIARTLSLVLWECGDDVLRELTVESVQPAPTSVRLLVTLTTPEGVDKATALRHVERASGLLRREVAAAINRRKTPELTFCVVRRET